MSYRKKLIEVALPLEDINREAVREKTGGPPRGHPTTLHLWWARRPLKACRAILFASLVDDPSSRPDKFPTELEQNRERKRLFRIIEQLIKWENTDNVHLLSEARNEILKSTNGNPPPVLDPFCGAGSIPLEAQRLGLEVHASDLNPIAVLITKAMIEIPKQFAGRPPVNPEVPNDSLQIQTWEGASGLAEDIRYYGEWMRNEAEERIGDLYPKVKVPKEQGGGEATVIAWIWARRVKCHNPACEARIPLVTSFWLSKKKEKRAWVEPLVNKASKEVQFEVKMGEGVPPEPTKIGRGARFRCLVCHQDNPEEYVKNESITGHIDAQLMAIVADGENGRIYLSPSEDHVEIAESAKPVWTPEVEMNRDTTTLVSGRGYGFFTWADLFTQRQLTALSTFTDLLNEVKVKVVADASATDCEELETYAGAILTYLAFAIDRVAMTCNTFARWNPQGQTVQPAFGKQSLAMIWDFADANVFGPATGNLSRAIELAIAPLRFLGNGQIGFTNQSDAASIHLESDRFLISTDPPYYNNVSYADLSDFFYIWLRRSLRHIYPNLFNLMLVPKTEELVADPHRFGGNKSKAYQHFLTGLSKAFYLMRTHAHPDYPMTVYYAFKQSEKDSKDGSISSTGWETMLEGLLEAGFQITGTLPIRTEAQTRQVAMETNALASSIVLVCRPRPDDAGVTTRRDFISVLRSKLPTALGHLQQGNIAPVDLAQAAIGPGMAVYSQYSKVLEADGTPMRVRTALEIINAELDAYFTAQEGDLDADTRFCVSWFQQYGMGEADYGEADVLARARDTSVEGISESGILHARAGRVRLLNRDEYPGEWDPASDSDLNTWKCTQYLIRALDQGGETETARLVFQLGSEQSENARELAYRLYAICDRNGWAQEAIPYNTLVTSWANIQAERRDTAELAEQQKLLPEES